MCVGITAAAAALQACGAGPAKLADLALTGTTPDAQRWRLQAGTPEPGDDVAASWCLRLRFTGDFVLGDDPFVGGVATCGRRPARRVSGLAVLACRHGAIFVFGGVRAGAGSVSLRPRRGPVVRATLTALPPRAGFDGSTFMIVARTRSLPAAVEADGAELARLPGRASVCRPLPGAPRGGEPSLDFETSR